jgi:uncharacterized protein
MGHSSRVAWITGRDKPVKPARTIRIGVLADTHGLFDPAIVQKFRGVDHIIHAGDVGT